MGRIPAQAKNRSEMLDMLKNPMKSMSYRISLLARPLYNSWCKIRMRRFESLLNLRPSHAIDPNYAVLYLLYRMVRKKKPRIVLEFGSGCSTVILAEALKDNGEGFLFSLESDEYY